MFKLGGFKKIEEQKTGIEPPEDDSYVRPNAEQFLAALELEKLLSEKYNVAPIDPKEISLQMLSAEYGPGIDLGEMEGAILDAFGGFDAEGEGVFDEDALPLPPIPPPVPGEVDDPGFHHGARDPSGLSPSDI